ncbi:MAG: S9 family peptidase, partial [candidate division Zixibacteria bacterium]|nr:S9 family peptidase [candidate division Zixibacteria bacterium]
YELGIYDRERDTVYYVSTDSIPGIYDQPEYLKELESAANDGNESDSAEALEEESEEEEKPRKVVIRGPWWSENGKSAFVVVMSLDFKDRWIMTLDAETGALSLLDWQHDDAWIGGPGIWGWTYQGEVGWTPDNKSVWFMSEETGYSQLYTVNASSKKKIRLTKGDFEVQNVRISRDKKLWYYVSNEVHPGEQHFYQLPIKGGTPTRLTFADGRHKVFISPDEKTLAIRYSFSNKPWELFVQDNKYGSSPKQITNSLSEEFNSYPWRSPKILTFTARDGIEVYARLYRPENPQARGPAVVFVHGAGYTQNAHRWWSKYYREYMFNNLLVDNGYTVLDIDYRASRGYGRECRTAIYRFMGGKDLTDNVDGARFLVDNYDIDSTRIGIYGGSYGGFITLMAMFTTPDVFSAGAALRPVTDWAHYNHGYTANILNTPTIDSLAFARSSPIYHAEGLKGALLMCHGMIDTNVHFQDVVRLAQRLIELGKENWEVAVYPLEAHSFKEPSSWTDEYRRIFKLFEDNLK